MRRNEPNIELQKAWDAVYENMEDNIALMLLVLHNECSLFNAPSCTVDGILKWLESEEDTNENSR